MNIWQNGEQAIRDISVQKKKNTGKGRNSPSRFFFNADWNHEAAEKIENAASVRYCAKAAKTEREKGLRGHIACTVCGDLNTKYHIICGDKKYHISMAGSDDIPTVDEIKEMWRRYKSGGKNAKQPKWNFAECRRNEHPTVKAISLCKYLATLLLPPDAYGPRRIVIPFSGSGSEGIGAFLAGWDYVEMIEKEKEYCIINKARVKYWQTHKEPIAKKSKPIVKKIEKAVRETNGAMELFPELA